MTYEPFACINAYPIVDNDAPSALKLFAAHALHQATRFQIGAVGLQEAIDELRGKAVQHQLIAEFGVTASEWIIGWAFAEVGVDYGDIRPHEGVYP